MDLTPNSAKSPEPEPDTPTRIHPFVKPVSFTNGVLKRHLHQAPPPASSVAVAYRECLKNHAASLGGHALDGCGEFMPSPSANDTDPTSIKCAACGCHRNFHRRGPDDAPPPSTPTPPATHVIEFQPHHRHHPPHPHPPPPRSPDSASPPPISSSYYGHHSAAPHVLLALSNAAAARDGTHPLPSTAAMVSPLSRKRFRTKFSQDQKERMFEFAERVGWRIQKRDDDIIHEFCHQIGVDRSVLKVWMHNNKNTLGKRTSDHQNSLLNINNAAVPTIPTDTDNNVNSSEDFDTPTTTTFNQTSKNEANGGYHHSHAGTNGSYSSS